MQDLYIVPVKSKVSLDGLLRGGEEVKFCFRLTGRPPNYGIGTLIFESRRGAQFYSRSANALNIPIIAHIEDDSGTIHKFQIKANYEMATLIYLGRESK